MIRKANIKEIDSIIKLVHDTINSVYNKYYPSGAVNTFIKYHSYEEILKDIEEEKVYVLEIDDKIVGTVTIKGYEVNRLFVIPIYQGCGYGSSLMDFAEELVSKAYNKVKLSASLQAKKFYLNRGYKESAYDFINCDNGDILCYDTLEKTLPSFDIKINYNGRRFTPKMNTENGEVNNNTIFTYHQMDKVIWAEYSGGEILRGTLIGKTFIDGTLEFNYQHINIKEEVRIGKCVSKPKVLENGKLELYENWQWLNGDKSSGESILIELEEKYEN